mmetsp:Transcript_84708/g.244887  ORF Transcript_84708/g.244887 Transcript_84708/m.244887 type:complete len:86 (-) Transcript_84708:25-282(-)
MSHDMARVGGAGAFRVTQRAPRFRCLCRARRRLWAESHPRTVGHEFPNIVQYSAFMCVCVFYIFSDGRRSMAFRTDDATIDNFDH